MQTSPCSQLLENVRPAPVSLNLEALESLPLMELLLQAEQPLSAPKMRATSVERKPNAKKQKAPTTLGIHNQINRLIGRISKPTGVAVPLTSHSFRRGGAQHANSEAAQAGLRRDQLLAVSMRLQETYRDGQQQTETKPTSNTTVSDQQTALIRELLMANRLLVNRLQALEEKWYAEELRLWSKDADRKKRSEARHVVAFMKLFLKLLSMANTLEKHCMKREAGSYIKKAEACTKQHLKAMTMYLYSTASKAEDYQDLALLSLMWYLFGRASDLSMLRKPNLALSNDTSLFIKLIRVKTSEEQGLTIFPDADFTTCPITALAAALATQTVPAFALLSQLPAIAPTTIAELGPGTSLRDIIEADGHITTSVSRDGPQTKGNSPGIHNYVNRLLDRIATPAGVKVLLSSHSFRRGGAQHANGSADLSPQWIFDRGAWNMTSTNKAFAYVFNTTSEDQKKKSELRQPIGFMRLFAGAYELRDGEAAYRDRVLETGASPSSGTKRKTSSMTILLKPTEQDPDYVLVHRAKTATLREYREPLPQSPRPLEPTVNPDNDAEVLYNDDSFDNPYAVLRHQFKDDNVDDDIGIVFRDPVT
ncbi:hypothetical protein ATCC90586_003481 [Pythium insidiosum]|nr:hypothetical protein ATCC90586_003481 [Pythium insidiosum]